MKQISLVFISIALLLGLFFGSNISAASSEENKPKGLSWLMLLLNKVSPIDTVNLATPYVNESDMKEMRQGFSSDKYSSPWGFVHDGFDITPQGNLKAFQAVCSGRVQKIFTGSEQVVVFIACNSTFSVEINFETQSPNTGQIQLANIIVTEGQVVSQGDIIGYHYAPNEKAHVHFSLFKNWITNCPEVYFSQEARNSLLNLINVRYPNANLCYGGDPTPPILLTPYVKESDMAEIRKGFSSDESTSPWGEVHDGLDIYPLGNLKAFQAVCSGIVDTLELRQDSIDSNWEVEVLIQCDDYVVDPDKGGYFIPYAVDYVFEPMSNSQIDGLAQFANITVVESQHVSQGDIVGYLDVIGDDSHVHFGLEMFGSSFFTSLGATRIPICPNPHFSSTANDSILNLLHVVWPNANICYY